MSEQDMAWAFAGLISLMMVVGAVWLWNNRTDKLESPIEPTSELTSGADAKSQALVLVTSGAQADSGKKARSKKTPKAHSAANCPLC